MHPASRCHRSGGVYDNTAVAAGTQTYGDGTTDPVGPVNSNTRSITFTSSLSATKSFLPTSISSGGQSTVTVRLSNSGRSRLPGLASPTPCPQV